MPTSTAPPAEAGTDECAVVADFPNLQVNELNSMLPIADLGPEFSQTELQLTRGDRTACLTQVPSPITVPGTVVDIGFSDPVNEILWRNADLLTNAAFAAGATEMVYEEVSGGTSYDGTYRYQMTAWRYDDSASAEDSLLLSLVENTEAYDVSIAGFEGHALSEGGDMFFFAFQNGEYVYTIESRTGADETGTERSLTDTESGRIPTEAFTTIAEWWQEHALVESDTSTIS